MFARNKGLSTMNLNEKFLSYSVQFSTLCVKIFSNMGLILYRKMYFLIQLHLQDCQKNHFFIQKFFFGYVSVICVNFIFCNINSLFQFNFVFKDYQMNPSDISQYLFPKQLFLIIQVQLLCYFIKCPNG